MPALKYLFVDMNGTFFPCEKIIENPTFSIGNLDDGIDESRVIEFVNIGKMSEERCKSCWAIRFCDICVSHCIDIDKNKLSNVQKSIACKTQEEVALEFLKKTIDERET